MEMFIKPCSSSSSSSTFDYTAFPPPLGSPILLCPTNPRFADLPCVERNPFNSRRYYAHHNDVRFALTLTNAADCDGSSSIHPKFSRMRSSRIDGRLILQLFNDPDEDLPHHGHDFDDDEEDNEEILLTIHDDDDDAKPVLSSAPWIEGVKGIIPTHTGDSDPEQSEGVDFFEAEAEEDWDEEEEEEEYDEDEDEEEEKKIVTVEPKFPLIHSLQYYSQKIFLRALQSEMEARPGFLDDDHDDAATRRKRRKRRSSAMAASALCRVAASCVHKYSVAAAILLRKQMISALSGPNNLWRLP